MQLQTTPSWQDVTREPKMGTTSATLVLSLGSLIMSRQLGVVSS